MRLFYSPFHAFIHKVLVTTYETGYWDDMIFVPACPFKNRRGEDQHEKYTIEAINPLDKAGGPTDETYDNMFGGKQFEKV